MAPVENVLRFLHYPFMASIAYAPHSSLGPFTHKSGNSERNFFSFSNQAIIVLLYATARVQNHCFIFTCEGLD